jgi:hypothetical protein
MTMTQADRRELALELQRELVRVTVERWDIERRIELELAGEAELEFLPETTIYDKHVSYIATACNHPDDVETVVTQEDADAFLKTVDEEAERYHAQTSGEVK